ncbi:uncharacterized protein LOC141533032 [Cotesia typhae]|uniref:uncharacterized protein LOC141533032 n=1 Tax=Cotesia typhae TaxID=2053667 RepID=UPI003D685DB7
MRNKAFQQLMVQPVKKAHGIRIDKKYDKIQQSYKQLSVTSTFTYVPLLETLTFIFNSESISNYFVNPREPNSTEYTHFIDGEVYQKNEFFKQNKHVIQLQLYFDEFEVCNPLGTKTGIHKIGAFYFTLLNLPSHLNSNLNHIHLLALCYNYDIKQFGISPVLDVIVKDIKILESKGIYVDSLNSIVKGTLVSLSCDNLGCATLLGMNESFSSNYYCRICTILKTDAQKTCEANDKILRTSESFIYLSKRLNCANSETLNFFEIKKFTPLCELNHFRISENYSIDVMHDFLEGICQRDLQLFFTFLIETRLISLEELNERIQAFDYGLNNIPNIPSGIKISKTSNSIGQHAAQTLCLITFLPLIIKDTILKIKQNDYVKWYMILLLIKMLKIALAPKITLEMLQDLETSTTMHHNILINNYAVNLTPKDHIVTHYPMIIRKMGPPKNQWTMRYESKNGFLKSYAEKLKNFIDIGFTLAERNQKSKSCFWNNDIKSLDCKSHLIETRKISISKLQYKLIILDHFSLSEEIKITVGKRIKFMGSELLTNKFICTAFSNNLPVFSRSVLFFSIYDELFMICESWKTIGISTSCLRYLIVNNSNTFIQKISDLPYTKNWQLYETSDKQFVIPTEYFL